MLNTHSKSIQDLRGIAVLMVVTFHVAGVFNYTDLYQVFKYGGDGVLLFFIISGFIICSVHSADRGADKFWNFAAKRILRIYAPYLIPFFIILFLFLYTGSGSNWHKDPVNIIRNIFLVQTPGQSIHPYAWSLVFEIYYYATFAFFVILLRVNVFIYAAIVMLPVLAEFTGMVNNRLGDSVPFSSINIYFVTGIVLAKFGAHFKQTNISLLAFPGIVLIFLIVFQGFEVIELYLLLVFIFIFYISTTFSFGLARFFGNASYSIYLVHAIVINVGKHLFLTRNMIFFILLLIISVVAGVCYYYLVEKPLVRLLQSKLTNKLQRTTVPANA